jgi:hypothetical protein
VPGKRTVALTGRWLACDGLILTAIAWNAEPAQAYCLGS